jgi:hypothetical protein
LIHFPTYLKNDKLEDAELLPCQHAAVKTAWFYSLHKQALQLREDEKADEVA